MKNQRIIKLLKIALFLIIILFVPNVKAAENMEYKIGDYVYFDPESDKKCTNLGYWTVNNQTGTCYRFLVLQNSSSSETTVRLMLDHNIANTTFYNYQEIINDLKTKWKNYDGDIQLISETETMKILKLGRRPEIGESIRYTDANGNLGTAFSPFRENSVYYIDGQKYNDKGFWTRTTHLSDSNYAYTVTESANNKPVLKTEIRGIRPVIVIDKSLVNDLLKKNEISLNKDKPFKKYQYLNQEFDGYIYYQMQGFTFTNDKLFFYSNHNVNTHNGLLFGYTGKNYDTPVGKIGYVYGGMSHGNDMTYNSKKDRILIVGAQDGKYILEFDPSTFDTVGPTKAYPIIEKIGISPSAIAYDKYEDIYFIKSNSSIISVSNDFSKIKDSFPVSHTESGQGIEYHNGYVYVVTTEVGTENCENYQLYQLYCKDEAFTGKIYVYNAKYNSDGTKSPFFGNLVGIIKTPTGIGELETISFKNDEMYLGYAAHSFDPVYSYKFYNTQDSLILTPSLSMKYEDGYVIISSLEELNIIDGWSISANKKEISNKVTNEMKISEICDRYNNCIFPKINTSVKFDTINFSDITTSYTGNEIKVDSATAESNSEINYTYYSDTECKNQIDSIVNVGTYSVKAKSVGNSELMPNSKCVKLTVNKGNPTILLNPKETNYTGNKISSNVATATEPNKKEVTLSYDYEYYSDNTCQKLLYDEPINAGTYYVKATSVETENLNSMSSACTMVRINKVNPIFNIQNTLSTNVYKTILVNYNTNSNGQVTCLSTNEEIATCKAIDNKIEITSKKIGETTINLTLAEDNNYFARQDIDVNINVTNDVTDRVNPIVSIIPDGDDNYTKIKNISVKFRDNETYILGNQPVYYAFSTSNSTSPNYTKTLNITSIDETEKNITIPVSEMETLTGTYYLWIKSGIKDGNNNETIEKVSQPFNFNNDKPIISAIAIKSTNKTKGTIYYKSLSKIKNKEYSTDNILFHSFTEDAFIIDNVLNDKMYIRITDELDQTSFVEATVEQEDKSNIEYYILDKNNNLISNNIIELNNKELVYNININIPSIDRIVEKYSDFVIENTIDNKIVLEQEKIIILNKSNEEVTRSFKIDLNNNILTIKPKSLSDNSFYNQNYNIKIQARIKDDYNPVKEDNKITNIVKLKINKEQELIRKVESNIQLEKYNVLNTALNYNKLCIILGLILLLVGTYILFKNINNSNS